MSTPRFREAKREELSAIVEMLANDPLGATREGSWDPIDEAYVEAFEVIDADPNQNLVVAVLDDRVVGVLQLTFVPFLTYRGGWRGLVEGVRVHEDFRGRSLGQALFEEAIRLARERGCHVVQLNTDKRRPDAVRFYEKLGFVASHEGMKLHL